MTRQALIKLPWPPSVNSYWRHMVIGGRPRSLISEAGRDYTKAVGDCVLEQRIERHALSGKLSVDVVAYPPDLRARDLDNLPKGVLDSLKKAGVLRDDSDIDDLRIRRGPVHKGGALFVIISEIPGLSTTSGFLFDKARATP